MDGLSVIALGVLVLLLTPIVVRDLSGRPVSDRWILALGAAGAAYDLIREPSWSNVLWTGLQVAVVFAILAVAFLILSRFARSWTVGLGDGKFLLVACPWVGLEGTVALLVLAGMSLAVVAALSPAPAEGGRWSGARSFTPMLAAGLFLVTVAVELSR